MGVTEFSEKIKDIPNFALHCLYCVVAWIFLICVVVPVCALVFIPLYLWKAFVVVPLAKKLRPDFISALDPFDGILATDDFYGKSFSSLGISLTLEGAIDYESFCTEFQENVLDARNENGTCVFDKMFLVPVPFVGYYFWKRAENFNIKDHIRQVKTYTSERDFQRYCGEWMTSPYPKGKPLWEILVHTNYATNNSATTIRIHHSVSDGLTLVKTFDAMTKKPCLPNFTVKEPVKKSMWHKMKFLAEAPLTLVHLYYDNITHSDWFTKPKKSQEAVMSWTIVPRESIRAIRHQTDSHFAIVGMSLLAGALRKHLKAITPSENFNGKNMRILVPLPWAKHPNDRMVNQWTMGIVKAPLNYKSAKTWLSEIQSEFVSEIQSGSPLFSRYTVPFITLFPAPFIRMILGTNFGMSISFTSVPGSNTDSDLFLMGHRLTKMIPLYGLQWSQTAVTASVFTYKDQAHFTILANKDIVPNQESMDRLVDDFLHEKVNELLSDDQSCFDKDKQFTSGDSQCKKSK